MAAPRASVVISAKNRAVMLFDCFEGLARQTLGKDRFEVVLVDNQSAETLAPVAQRARDELGLTVVFARTVVDHGPAPARNLGVTLSHAPILAFTDSDCRPSPDWLAAGLNALDDPAVALVTGPALPKPGKPVTATCKLHFNYVEHPTFPTMNVFYRRSVFEDLGGFDTTLSVHDPLGRAVEAADADLAWRVIKAPHARRFAPEAIIYHEVEDLGLIGYLIDPTRDFLLPERVRGLPELRFALLTGRVFFHPSSWLIYVAIGLVTLAAQFDLRILLLVPAMLVARAIVRTRSLDPSKLMRFCGSAAMQLPRNMVMNLTLLYGSIRYRCLVL